MSTEKLKKALRLPMFGKKTENVPLKLNHMWNGDQMPFSLKSCFAFIYCYNIEVVHIFRKNGNKVAHEVLSSYLKKNLNVAPTFYASSIHDVCSAIRAYVKDIPGGLLVKELEHEWHKLVRLNNETKVREKLTSIINKLPITNRSMLFHLLFIASAVVEHRSKNEMSAKSISIIFMPTMFERVVDIRKVRDLYGFYDLLEFMIDNAASMMGNDIYEKIGASLREIGGRLHVIQEVEEENAKLDDDKRVIFVSQDSGLNSTSFIDEKESQSLSNISRTNVNDYDRGIISSIEDLLNTSNISSEINDDVYRSSTLMRTTKSIISPDTSFSILERSNSHKSTFSEEDCRECHADRHRIAPSANRGQQSCVGSKLHSIKECRPYSICGPLSLANISEHSPAHQLTSSTVNLYTPVYDRSFQKLDLTSNYQRRHHLSSKETEDDEPFLPGLKVQRKRSILKRSSCIIAPLERLSLYSAKPHLATSTSMTTTHSSSTTNHNLFPASPTLSRTCKGQVQSKQKFRVKRKQTLFRSRLSVPIRRDDVEAPVLPSQRMIRAASLQQQSHHTPAPLPQPLNFYLYQRSSEETFV